MSTSGLPSALASVGTSGASAEGCADDTASATSLPAFTCGSTVGVARKPQSASPESTASVAGAGPLYGTCCIVAPVVCSSISAARWPGTPAPPEA